MYTHTHTLNFFKRKSKITSKKTITHPRTIEDEQYELFLFED